MERRAIIVRGIVQGVGFRPYVFGLASRLGLGGFVQNQTSGVLIEIEGESRSLDRFLAEIAHEPPPLARIEGVSWESRAPRGEPRFRVDSSRLDDTGPILISPEVATCQECLAELFDPGDRRYRYPFINCTNCGPRLTIITAAPYDRVGLGGYHWVCDARNGAAVVELRRRKQRDEKTLAVMVRDLEGARALCEVLPEEGGGLERGRVPERLADRRGRSEPERKRFLRIPSSPGAAQRRRLEPGAARGGRRLILVARPGRCSGREGRCVWESPGRSPRPIARTTC